MPNKFKNPYLMHSWGKTPEQKARERAYNHKYYEEHKEKLLKKAHSLENQTVKPYMARAQQAVTGAREAVRSAGNRMITNATGALLDNDLFKKTLVKAGHNTGELGKLYKRSRQASRAAGTAANEAAKAQMLATKGYDSRYDTKLGRDIQNTMSKFRKYTKKRNKR